MSNSLPLLNVLRDSLREFDCAKTVRPFLLGQQIFKKHGLHTVPQLAQFLGQIVDNPRDARLGLALHSRYHQNAHLRVAPALPISQNSVTQPYCAFR